MTTTNYAAALAAKIAEAAKTGPNMTQAQAGGDEYTPPALGLARARFVGYFEMGKHEEEYQGQKRTRDKVDLVFELSGPNHPPRQLADGTRVPQRITVKETKSLSDKANFFKLFGMMNYAGKATHMAQLLGDPFVVEVFHRQSKDGKRTYANLKGPNGYNIKGTSVQDPLSGKTVTIDVDPPMTEIKAFIWDIADLDMWNSIHIEGVYEEKKNDKGEVIQAARSKNVLQDMIRTAINWKEHPLAAIVEAGSVEPELPDAETPGRANAGAASDDPLANIG